MNREAWLEQATAKLSKDFESVGLNVPDVRVSVGWPSKRATSKNKRIGECWSPGTASDSVAQIFISPILAEPVQVLETLVHELVHAALPQNVKHGAPFRRAMKLVGLEGKPTATHAGESLTERLNGLSKELGEFPHGNLTPTQGKKQTTRLIKGQCVDCGYTVRITRKWIDFAGPPICPLDEVRMAVAS